MLVRKKAKKSSGRKIKSAPKKGKVKRSTSKKAVKTVTKARKAKVSGVKKGDVIDGRKVRAVGYFKAHFDTKTNNICGTPPHSLIICDRTGDLPEIASHYLKPHIIPVDIDIVIWEK